MAKILLLVAVFAAVYFIVRGYARGMTRTPDPPQVKGEEDMVKCRYCGIHLPRSESSSAAGDTFCSEEHRRLHGL